MKRLLIVYHTMTGAAQQLASAAHSAASDEAGCSTELVTAGAADVAHVLSADGYLFVTPENLATMAGRPNLTLESFCSQLCLDQRTPLPDDITVMMVRRGVTDGAR